VQGLSTKILIILFFAISGRKRMKISELSAEYRDSAMLCRGRIKELNLKLEGEPMCEIDRLRLRRRIAILTSMMRDTIAVSRYLENYYGDDMNAGKKTQYVC